MCRLPQILSSKMCNIFVGICLYFYFSLLRVVLISFCENRPKTPGNCLCIYFIYWYSWQSTSRFRMGWWMGKHKVCCKLGYLNICWQLLLCLHMQLKEKFTTLWYCSNDFDDNTSRESNLIRLQTLYYADKRKIDVYIIELLAWLHHLISFVKSKQNTLRSIPTRSPPKVLELQSKMRQFLILSVDSGNKPLGTQISQEDRKLLEEVIARRNNSGLSKSEDLGLAKKRQVKDLHGTKSAGSSPAKEIFGTRVVINHQNYNVLDIMDGLSHWSLYFSAEILAYR